MLSSVGFRNYRGFSEHLLPFRPETIVVGRNNAGKSTLIEGLRLVSIVTERYQNLNFKSVPNWLDLHMVNKGVQPDVSGLNLTWDNLFHQYQDPPASVQAAFGNGYEMTIYLGPTGSLHVVIRDPDGRPLRTKGDARSLDLPRLSVLPQVTPLAQSEVVLGANYVRSNMSSYLAPLHFRNQLNLYYEEYFADFKNLVESSWFGVQIVELEGRGGLPEDELMLLVRDGDFVAEAAWMGHGLQMWLQVMWFVTRTSGQSTVVLDEPDVYMHPDLQRRLLRLLRGRFKQILIATHSTEILAETEPSNVLILERNRRQSIFTNAVPGVQKVLDDIGSAQNLQLTKL